MIVGVLDCILELSNLSLNDLSSHGITYSVSEHYKVLRQVSLSFLEAVDSIFELLLELSVHKFLSLFLYYSVRVVLTQLFVDRSTKSHD